MKKLLLTGVLLMAGLGIAAAQSGNTARISLRLTSFVLENKGSSNMDLVPDYDGDEGGVILSGTADGQCASLTGTGDFGQNGKRRLIVKVSGLNSKCRFDAGKLFKMAINGSRGNPEIPLSAESLQARNPNDPAYNNARNGEFVFDISSLGNINQISLVFYNCTLADVKMELFAE